MMTLGAAAARIPVSAAPGSGRPLPAAKSSFSFALNTSTLGGGEADLVASVEIAAAAGYDGVEIWMRDLVRYLESGHAASDLRDRFTALGIEPVSAIGFAPWLAPGEEGMEQMRREMELLAGIGCKRIAAPPSGLDPDVPLDLFYAGEKYRRLLAIGRETGVMPQLEFWGSSPNLWHLGQALMVAAVAGDPGARILPDVYHMFRGGSDFATLGMLDGTLIDLFHMNDYPGEIPRERMTDADRVYPGEGTAPMDRILGYLSRMGGTKILSLELFNRSYWQMDPRQVAETGLRKMKTLVETLE